MKVHAATRFRLQCFLCWSYILEVGIDDAEESSSGEEGSPAEKVAGEKREANPEKEGSLEDADDSLEEKEDEDEGKKSST